MSETPLRRFRILQIRALAVFLSSMGERSAGCRGIVRLRSDTWARSLINAALAYRRTFSSFAEAQACASSFIQAGHEHPDEIRYHTSISDTVRESDYPVLFHLAPLACQLQRIFDFGGNVGNLFYAYQREVSFSPNLTWSVYDLPVKKPLGEKVAAERGEVRLQFVDSLEAAGGSDVFIASGSLHYFEQPLDEILRSVSPLPTHVFVNRSPFSTGEELITVQDNRSYLVPCKLHSRARLLSGMARLGYDLVAEWPVHERKLRVPMYPDVSSRTYSGFYFRKRGI